MNTRDVLRLLRDDGWVLVRQAGSQAQYQHPKKPGTVTVPMHGRGKNLKPDTLNIN